MDRLYVATPSLLAHYGIAPGAVDPTADVLSARTDLGGLRRCTRGPRMDPLHRPVPARPVPYFQVLRRQPQGPIVHPAAAVHVSPRTLLTTNAMPPLGLEAVPAAWL